jgi:hypothetical protein
MISNVKVAFRPATDKSLCSSFEQKNSLTQNGLCTGTNTVGVNFIFLVSWSGVRLHLVRRPLIGLLYQPLMIVDVECGAVGWMRTGGGNRNSRRKPAPVPFCPPQTVRVTYNSESLDGVCGLSVGESVNHQTAGVNSCVERLCTLFKCLKRTS